MPAASTENLLPDGVFAASLTPLSEDMSVDYQALAAHCRWLLEQGADGAALLGTTGEANSFGLRERIGLIEGVLEHGIPSHRLLVGTGCCAFPDTVALTRFAVESGAGGILMLPPFYYKPVSDEGLYRYFSLVVDQVKDSRLRIYLYHFPKLTGVPFSAALTERLALAFPDIVVGMKDSGGEWAHMKEVCERLPGFRLFAGTERYLADVLNIGGVGCISATANATVALAAEVYRRWRAGEDVSAAQAQLSAIRQAFEAGGFVPVLKQLFARWQQKPEWLQMRPPMAPLPESLIDGIAAEVERLGLRIAP
ncbi:MAG: dihydrodipicolinate synthase family protein [Phaeodactylibacter sp.]|nr:dihydrodipicolinate synthase family protein [Phaeodactylibacter sp.]MCB9272637.1 dihydrodipicolinate synthase family protein [Lewinellaceae bacterium]